MTGTGWPPSDDSRPSISRWAKLGAVERLALDLFDEMMVMLETDGWQDLIEAAVMDTTEIPIEDDSPNAMDKFFDEMERLEKRVMLRACRAMVNSLENRYDKISDLSERRASEKAMQT